MAEVMHVQMKDLQNLRVCIEAAKEDPSHLEMVAAAPAVATTLTEEGVEAAATAADANRGLLSFQCVPKDSKGRLMLKGPALLDHMVQYGRRMAVSREPHLPSSYLDVEFTKLQGDKILNPQPEDYSAGAILRDTVGHGAKQKLARRQLDAVGDVRSACGVANTPDRIRRLKVFIMGYFAP
jgi:hypothetical protein